MDTMLGRPIKSIIIMHVSCLEIIKEEANLFTKKCAIITMHAFQESFHNSLFDLALIQCVEQMTFYSTMKIEGVYSHHLNDTKFHSIPIIP